MSTSDEPVTMWPNPKDKWLSSHQLARLLLEHRDTDVRVRLGEGDPTGVPVAGAHYHSGGDMLIVDLIEGEDLLAAAAAACNVCGDLSGDEMSAVVELKHRMRDA